MEEGDGLGDLMEDVWEGWDEAGKECAAIEATAIPTKIDERQDGEATDGVAVEVLRPRIVEAVEVELKEGWGRPDKDSRKDRGVTSDE
jgi:hypothetical protein